MNTFITATGIYLPGAPVTNEELDDYMIGIDRVAARTRRIILKNNGIDTRYYALEKGSGRLTHTNAELTAEAVRKACDSAGLSLDGIECLSCGSSSPDQLMPGHGSMVQAELAASSCEINSSSGICLSGIMSMKYGAMSVAAGLSHNAVVTGSELASSFLRPSYFKNEVDSAEDAPKKRHPAFAFEAEFLRWMLSDGAGAMVLENKPRDNGLSLKVEWIEIISQAHRMETCMYAGSIKNDDGSITGWRALNTLDDAESRGAFPVKQDAKLLNDNVIRTLVRESLPELIEKYNLRPDEIDWFLPHYSSDYFRKPVYDHLAGIDFAIDYSRWFTNLSTRGNTGSASFYIMLDELFNSGRLKKGDRILCFIPESGRFAVGYVLLEAV
ncbi:MAG: beta-ketoacyl-ACP synthase III [Thermodesulfobacteriota bacterium]